MNQSLQAPAVLRHHQPNLIRTVGALTFIAVTASLGAHYIIEAWLDAQMFAAGTLGPAPVQIGPNVWAARVGGVGAMPTANLEALTHSALHYKLLSMAIFWTTAAACAVVCMRIDESIRPSDAQPNRVLAPARM